MYKNQLQELAQRSCFGLPSYACTREGPDHAPRFKASVTFNGEIFLGPSNCTTLRQAEHAAAEIALVNLSIRGPSRSLTARVLDETGVYKNLLQETAHRAGLKLPAYTTVRSGPGHSPVFSSTVELAGLSFSGEPAKTKKQAEKNAAMAAWSALKQMPDFGSCHQQQTKESEESQEQEQEQVTVARVLSSFKPKEESKPLMKQRSMHLACQQKWKPPNPPQRRFMAPPPLSGPKILPPLHLLKQCDPDPQNPKQLEEEKQQQDEGKQTAANPAGPQPHHQFSNKSDLSNQIMDQKMHQIQLGTRAPIGPPPSTTTGGLLWSFPRLIASGGYHAAGIAPAVHVRSVIPVCAVPPMRPAPSSAVPAVKKGDEASVAASKFNNLHI